MMMPISFVVAREALEGMIGDNHTTYTLASIPPAVIWTFFRNSPFKGFRMFLGITMLANAAKFNGDTGGLAQFEWGPEYSTPGAWYRNLNTKPIFSNSQGQQLHHSGSDWLRGKHETEPTWKQFEEK